MFVWHLSLLVSISLDLRQLALRLGWLKKSQTVAEKKKREEDLPRRIRKGDRPEKKEEEEAKEISNMGMKSPAFACLCCLCLYRSFASFFVNLQFFFSL